MADAARALLLDIEARVFDAGVGAGTVLANSAYLEATREALQKHGGLWGLDESYVVSRRRP